MNDIVNRISQKMFNNEESYNELQFFDFCRDVLQLKVTGIMISARAKDTRDEIKKKDKDKLKDLLFHHEMMEMLEKMEATVDCSIRHLMKCDLSDEKYDFYLNRSKLEKILNIFTLDGREKSFKLLDSCNWQDVVRGGIALKSEPPIAPNRLIKGGRSIAAHWNLRRNTTWQDSDYIGQLLLKELVKKKPSRSKLNIYSMLINKKVGGFGNDEMLTMLFEELKKEQLPEVKILYILRSLAGASLSQEKVNYLRQFFNPCYSVTIRNAALRIIIQSKEFSMISICIDSVKELPEFAEVTIDTLYEVSSSRFFLEDSRFPFDYILYWLEKSILGSGEKNSRIRNVITELLVDNLKDEIRIHSNFVNDMSDFFEKYIIKSNSMIIKKIDVELYFFLSSEQLLAILRSTIRDLRANKDIDWKRFNSVCHFVDKVSNSELLMDVFKQVLNYFSSDEGKQLNVFDAWSESAFSGYVYRLSEVKPSYLLEIIQAVDSSENENLRDQLRRDIVNISKKHKVVVYEDKIMMPDGEIIII